MSAEHYNIIIIGGGPAGLMAAIESYMPGRKIAVLEKMPNPGIKLKLTGKGRCNITNAAILNEFLKHFGKNFRFLKYAFSEFFNTQLLDYFGELGVKFKLERGGRYFPESDSAGEILNAMAGKLKALKIPILTQTEVMAIEKEEDGFRIKTGSSIEFQADRVVIATGGKSYPKTGSTGAGYSFAKKLGHTIIEPRPALVPIETGGGTAKKLQGLSLRNARLEIRSNNKKITEEFGEMVFTDFGLSGPVILTLSPAVLELLDKKQDAEMVIDLKPALDHKAVDKRLLREIQEAPRQGFKRLLKNLLPSKMIPVFLEMLNVDENKKLNQLSADDRKQVRLLLKEFKLKITGCRGFNHAVITAGGIKVQEINPQTMESKLIPGLYFAGEIIDIDADTGGYNLQAAFSTGWIAGQALRK